MQYRAGCRLAPACPMLRYLVRFLKSDSPARGSGLAFRLHPQLLAVSDEGQRAILVGAQDGASLKALKHG
jgi:hypothetical protein